MSNITWIPRESLNAQRVEVKDPIKLPDMETLKASRDGMTRRMLKESDPERRYRLKAIRDEFDFLIETL